MAGRIRIILCQFRVAVDAARKPLTVFGFTDRADHSAASLLHPTLPGGPLVPGYADLKFHLKGMRILGNLPGVVGCALSHSTSLSFAPHFSLIPFIFRLFCDSSRSRESEGRKGHGPCPHSLSARDMGRRASLRL